MEVGFPHYIYLYSFIFIYHLYPKSGDSFCDIFYGDVLTHRSVTKVSYFTPKATHMFSDRKHLLPNKYWLVVWNMAFICFYEFPYIGNFIIPTDELIFFRGVGQPPTSWFMVIWTLHRATKTSQELVAKLSEKDNKLLQVLTHNFQVYRASV